MSSISESLKVWEAASGLLASKRIPGFLRRRAVNLLAQGFFDVPLPTSPLSLSKSEAAEIRRDVASDMQRHFAAAAAAAESGRFDEEDHEKLAEAVDPLWVALAATEWETVRRIEQARHVYAVNLLMDAMASAVQERQDARALLESMRESLLDDGPAGLHARDMFATMGLGRHHALHALNKLLNS